MHTVHGVDTSQMLTLGGNSKRKYQTNILAYHLVVAKVFFALDLWERWLGCLLYTDDYKIVNSMLLWGLHTPPVYLKFAAPEEKQIIVILRDRMPKAMLSSTFSHLICADHTIVKSERKRINRHSDPGGHYDKETDHKSSNFSSLWFLKTRTRHRNIFCSKIWFGNVFSRIICNL